jgi:hypothetical protein
VIGRNKLHVEMVYAFEPSIGAYVSKRMQLARLWGAQALRLQLRDFVLPHLPEEIELNLSGLSLHGALGAWQFRSWLKSRRRAVFILLKHTAYRLTPGQLAQLREKAIAVGIDHKDGDPSRLGPSLHDFDFHISASEAGRRALEAMLDEEAPRAGRRPFVDVWYQSHDRRLDNVQPRELDRLGAVYLGSPKHAVLPASLSGEVTIIDIQRSEDMEPATQALGGYNFHFAVRPSPKQALRRSYKPFTKGVTAAACYSNVLVNRQVDDAVEFLTPDYPYLVDSNAPAHVEEGFRKAKEEFGGPEWRRGLEIMRALRERLSGPAQARQLAGIVTRAAEGEAGRLGAAREDEAGVLPDLPEIGIALGGVGAAR